MKRLQLSLLLLFCLAISLACGGGGGSGSNSSGTVLEKPERLDLESVISDNTIDITITSDNTIEATASVNAGEGFSYIGGIDDIEDSYIYIHLLETDSSGNYLVTEEDFLILDDRDSNNPYMTNVIVMKKVIAAGNSFTMGSSSDSNFTQSNETEHSVTFSSNFYMGVYELTQRQWAYITNNNPANWGGQIRPVEKVDYEILRGDPNVYNWPASDEVDPNSFLGVLRTRTGLRFDLPTEAEWEYVCKAGTGDRVGSDGTVYNSDTFSGNLDIDDLVQLGGDLEELGIYLDNNPGFQDVKQTTDVGGYLPNAWGFYDMLGNVWEWCKDAYVDDLGTASVTDPAGATSGDERVIRGSFYGDSATNMRSAKREPFDYSNSAEIVGLRLYIQGDIEID